MTSFRLLRWIGVSAISLGLLEAALWIWAPLPVYQQQPVTKSFVQTLPGLKPEIVYTENAFGFRSRSMRTLRKPRGTIRVVCLGASTTQQTMQATDDMWSAHLERMLQRQFASAAIEVAAYGRGGMMVADGVDWCQGTLPILDADLVIVLWGVNDLAWHGGPDYRYDPSILRQSPQSWKKRVLRKYSQLYRRFIQLEKRLKLTQALRTGRAVEWHSEALLSLRLAYAQAPYRAVVVRHPDPVIEFSDRINQLAVCVTQQRRRLIVLGQPTLWKSQMAPEEQGALWFAVHTPEGPVHPSGAWLEQEMRRYNDIQRRAAEAVGASYLPLDRLIPKTLDYFVDDCHVTDRGSLAMAEAVFPTASTIVEEILAQRQKP